jgi:hypothetical protein
LRFLTSPLWQAGSAIYCLAPPLYQHCTLSGFRGQMAQLRTRKTLWWSLASDVFSLSLDITSHVLGVRICSLRLRIRTLRLRIRTL